MRITVTPASAREFTLFLRKPTWSRSVKLSVGGAALAAPKVEKGYFAVRRNWKPGDVVTVQFDMEPRLVAANPLVRENIGRVAVERGPLVYCLEGLDQPKGASLFDWSLRSRLGAELVREAWKPEMLGGIVTLTHQASRPTSANTDLRCTTSCTRGAGAWPGRSR